jgi:hypothetical protein
MAYLLHATSFIYLLIFKHLNNFLHDIYLRVSGIILYGYPPLYKEQKQFTFTASFSNCLDEESVVIWKGFYSYIGTNLNFILM